MNKYTCMCCWFQTFEDVFSGYEICIICWFQDDFSAIQNPNISMHIWWESLFQEQRKILLKVPATIQEHKNYLRSTLWTPIVNPEIPYFPQWKMDEFLVCYPDIDIQYFEKFITN